MHIVKGVFAAVLALVIGAVGFVYVFPAQATRVALDAERQRSGLERREILLPDGMRYVYLEGGKGPALLLLHGFGANKDNFTRVARFLVPHYRVIVPDHIGFGESARPEGTDYSPTAQARRLRALAHALNARRVHLGGSSMGGQIAMTYASLFPDEVGSLWLLDPAGVWSAPLTDLRKEVEKTRRNPLIVRSEDEFAHLYGLMMSDPPFIPRPMLDAMAQERIANVALEERILEQLTADSVEARVTGLTTPTLIVWGGEDRALHVGSAEILKKLMPRSQIIVMPGVGHLPMVERPRQSADDYLKFRASF